MATDDSRRFLIAAGTAHYREFGELPSVPEDLRKIVGFFSRVGYSEQLPEIRHDPSSAALRVALSGWLHASNRHAADTVVIYYSGHGDIQAGYFYLLTADTRQGEYEATAFPADSVLKELGEIPTVRRMLLIIDACYAGQGALEALTVAARMASYQNFTGEDEGVWVVAATSPKQEAEEGYFVDAFVQAAEHQMQTTDSQQKYVSLDVLIGDINAILRSRERPQRANWAPGMLARGVAPFIPNPSYQPDNFVFGENVDLETRDWLLRQRAEFAGHWDPKARGVEVAAQTGRYFTGREAALRELAGWLADPGADLRLWVLTGDPGSGKSAVVGRLVTLTDPRSAPAGATPGEEGLIPPVGSITCALLARRKSAEDLLKELRLALHVEPDADLTVVLAKWPVFTVVIDALDEASSPSSVVANVISPLTDAGSLAAGPRVLVATRRHLLGLLPAARVTVDLDLDAYRDVADIARYVAKVLLAVDDPDFPTPYRGERQVADTVAREVAAVAGRSFLIAQIAARTLARNPGVLDAAELNHTRERWRDVGAAFDLDLSRYRNQAPRVRELLTPLAYAEGAGLSRHLWAPLATALANGRRYSEEDIDWLLEHAGCYLVEALDRGEAVYRLFHEQFAEHLRAARDAAATERLVTSELLAHVPVAADGRREWLAAPFYVRTHLASHAARARVLDPLVSDPGFLLAADPGRLLPAMVTVTTQDARQSARAFESVQHGLRGRTLGEAAAQLNLAAHVHGATVLAAGISRLPFDLSWSVEWGHWAPPDRHVVVGRHGGEVTAVAAGTLDGTPVAVSGGGDGTVRVWDLRAGSARGQPLAGHEGVVLAVAVGQVDGVPVAVSGGDDGTVRVWDLRTVAAWGEPLAINERQAQAVALGTVDGVPLAISAHGNRVRIWGLTPGTAGGAMLSRNPFTVTAVAIGEVDGVPVAIWGDTKGFVTVWDLRSGKRRGRAFAQHYAVNGVAISEVGGAPVAVCGDPIGVRVWNLRTRAEHVADDLTSHLDRMRFIDLNRSVSSVAAGEVDGVPVAVSGGIDGHVWVQDLGSGTIRGDPFSGHTGVVSAIAANVVDDVPVAVSGGADGTVRVWDLRSQAASGQRTDADTAVVCALAASKVYGVPVAISGGADRHVRVWDLRTGAAMGEPFAGHKDQVWAVAAGEVDGVPVAVSGGADGTIWVSDLRTGTALGEPLLRKRLRRREWRDSQSFAGWLRDVTVAAGDIDGTPVAVGSAFDTTLRVWDLRTHAALGKLRVRHSGAVYAVAVGKVDGVPLAVSGGEDGLVWIWNLRTGTAEGALAHGPFPGAVNAVAVGEADGVPIAVSAHDDRTVRFWDLRTGALRGEPLTGHSGVIKTLAVGYARGTPVAVSGDDNGTVLQWALGRGRHRPVRLDAPAGVNAIAYSDRTGWLTATSRGRDSRNVYVEKGSLFLWTPIMDADR